MLFLGRLTVFNYLSEAAPFGWMLLFLYLAAFAETLLRGGPARAMADRN